jgi:hypothetical protein
MAASASLRERKSLLAQRSMKKLVAGAGFEPAIPQARDYEPNRDRPISR